MNNNLNGYAAEACLNKAAAESRKIHSVKLENVIAKCKISQVGRRHYESAFSFLCEDYGNISFEGNKRVSVLDESAVPEGIAADLILGLDVVISFLGYTIGIDITVNENSTGRKLKKKQSLSDVYKKDFEIDFTIILIATERFTSTDLETLLKQAIKDGSDCQILSI